MPPAWTSLCVLLLGSSLVLACNSDTQGSSKITGSGGKATGGVGGSGGSMGTGGSVGVGGAVGSGGVTGSGGGTKADSGVSGGTSGGGSGGAGGSATGLSDAAAGGAQGTGGVATGGRSGTGGAPGSGGASSGGATGKGGSSTGGVTGTGGASSKGGAGSGGSTGTGGSGTGGSGTGGAATACVADTPPAKYLETIQLTWAEMNGDYEGKEGARPKRLSIMNFHNFIWDQVFATGGTQSYCIRWESTGTLTAAKVTEIEGNLQKLSNTWFDYLKGYNCWPFTTVAVKVVGVAVADRNRASWADGAGVPVYVGDMYENAPECPQACGRFFHQDNDYSKCPGGKANHYDRSLWLTDGIGGSGGDWGMRMAPNDFNMDGMAWMSIHEFGHGLGFPDYYNWDKWVGNVAQPVAIMSNSPSGHETDWDVAMLKYTWDRVKPRLLP